MRHPCTCTHAPYSAGSLLAPAATGACGAAHHLSSPSLRSAPSIVPAGGKYEVRISGVASGRSPGIRCAAGPAEHRGQRKGGGCGRAHDSSAQHGHSWALWRA